VDHLCRVKLCINPAHLEYVTSAENVRRGFSPFMLNARKTHCSHGHRLDGDNLFYDQGKRQCLTCHRRRSKESMQRQRTKRKSLA